MHLRKTLSLPECHRVRMLVVTRLILPFLSYVLGQCDAVQLTFLSLKHYLCITFEILMQQILHLIDILDWTMNKKLKIQTPTYFNL